MLIGKTSALVMAALALLGVASPAGATTISYTNFEVVNDVNVHIGCAGIPDCISGYYGSGQFQFYNNGHLVAQTWCIDVSHDVLGPWSSLPGPSNVFQVTLPVNNGGISNIRNDGGSGHGDFLSWSMLGEIGGLMKYGTDHIGDNYDVSSAVQLAIWDLEYGSAITTASDSPSVQAMAAWLLADAISPGGLVGKDWDVAWLQQCDEYGRHCNQGQLMLLVPEPPALLIFGSALMVLLGSFGFGRIRRGGQA